MAKKKSTPAARLRAKPAKRLVLSTERVVDAAIALADAEGLSELSMRKLAQRVGVEAMSLYHHVANKEALLDAMVEAVMAEVVLPRVGMDWREQMRRRVLSEHDALRRHPWASILIVSRMNVGPNMLRFVDLSIGCFIEAGFSPELADHAHNALESFVHGFTLHELNFPVAPDEYASTAAEFLPQLSEADYPYIRKLGELVSSGSHDGVNHLEFGLDLLLDGLERVRMNHGNV